MTIDNEFRPPHKKRPKNPPTVTASKDIHQEIEEWASFDPAEGALEILSSRSPLDGPTSPRLGHRELYERDGLPRL